MSTAHVQQWNSPMIDLKYAWSDTRASKPDRWWLWCVAAATAAFALTWFVIR